MKSFGQLTIPRYHTEVSFAITVLAVWLLLLLFFSFIHFNIPTKVAVKVLIAKKKHFLEDNPEFQARGKLYREAYSMSRLNRVQHPNFPVLLCHDTKGLPYHLITKLEIWSDLLQLLRKSREKNPNLSPPQLLSMLIDISEALRHLENLGLVHRAIMAENVLVGEKFTCKLSGLHSLQQLPVNDSSSEGNNNMHYILLRSKESYTAVVKKNI